MRRRLLTIAAFGLIGIAVSFASAWGCIFWRVFVAKRYLGAPEGTAVRALYPGEWPSMWPSPESVDVTRSWGYERRIASGSEIEYHPVLPIPKVELGPDDLRMGPLDPSAEAHRLLMRAEAMTLPQFAGGGPKRVASYMAFWRGSGWPLVCMRSSWRDEHVTEYARGGVATRQSLGSGMDLNTEEWTARMFYGRGIPWPDQVLMPDGTTMQFTLPLAPIWPGFVVNTVFWSGAAWLTWRGVRAIRRHFRRAEGCCGHCGYPIGVSNVCTECGHSVRASAPEAAA